MSGEQRTRVRRRSDWWEKAVTFVAFPLFTAGLLGAVSILWEGSRADERLSQNVDHLIRAQTTILQRLSKLEVALNNIYTRAEANRKHGQIWRTDRDQYEKLSALEASLSDQASRIRGDVIAIQYRLKALDDD